MLIVKRFLLEETPLAIRPRLLNLLSQSLQTKSQEGIHFVRTFLGLLKEITTDRDTRMGFDDTCKFP